MTVQLGVVMDPIGSIKPVKDSTFAMLLAARRRGWSVWYMLPEDIWLEDGVASARMRALTVQDDLADWYDIGEERTAPLAELDIVLMRKDPPFDMEYIYATYILEIAESAGVVVSNPPQALRDINEKAAIAWFPELAPATLITRSMKQMRRFADAHGKVVFKPLDGMGGKSIFVVSAKDPNTNVILETLTDYGKRFAMAQAFVPDISAGDKRILLVDGEPVPYALARIPAAGENRGNLAAGATAVGQPLSAADIRLAEAIGPAMVERSLVFVGIDVIGDRLTEINITSPTCIRELDAEFGLDIAGDYMAALEKRLTR
ncbi:MAG: glutathione synthase [Gammaproteobacteria bacterium]|nr:glutathione synthase [Gammaproteobacteria bacterium]NNF61025.1 glutathione synthase [Gammaproteobacteria bacterium]NNM21887.1 glutathione synthase [Gammaproteobacteria bacterium]